MKKLCHICQERNTNGLVCIHCRNKGRCRYCHRAWNLTVDHILPKSRGGKNYKKNLQTLCAKCNQHKSNRTDKEIVELFRLMKEQYKTSPHIGMWKDYKWMKWVEEGRKEPLDF